MNLPPIYTLIFGWFLSSHVHALLRAFVASATFSGMPGLSNPAYSSTYFCGSYVFRSEHYSSPHISMFAVQYFKRKLPPFSCFLLCIHHVISSTNCLASKRAFLSVEVSCLISSARTFILFSRSKS